MWAHNKHVKSSTIFAQRRKSIPSDRLHSRAYKTRNARMQIPLNSIHQRSLTIPLTKKPTPNKPSLTPNNHLPAVKSHGHGHFKTLEIENAGGSPSKRWRREASTVPSVHHHPWPTRQIPQTYKNAAPKSKPLTTKLYRKFTAT
jgi:hypothetical protein